MYSFHNVILKVKCAITSYRNFTNLYRGIPVPIQVNVVLKRTYTEMRRVHEMVHLWTSWGIDIVKRTKIITPFYQACEICVVTTV